MNERTAACLISPALHQGLLKIEIYYIKVDLWCEVETMAHFINLFIGKSWDIKEFMLLVLIDVLIPIILLFHGNLFEFRF